MKIKYWVPENMMFEDAGTCLDTRPDDGAAALVVSHVAYDKAINTLKFVKEKLKPVLTEPGRIPFWEVVNTLKELDQD